MATWEQNKDFIVSQVQAGKATPGQIDWYNRWVASGSPESQAGMVAGVQTGPQIGFGDSYIGAGGGGADSNAENRFNQLMQTQQKNDVVDDGAVDDGTADTGAAPDETAMNQAFLQMLYNLGLSNLYNNLFTNFQQQQAAVPTLPTQGMLGKPQFGVAPVRRGYLPPQVVPQSSIAQDTGLLQYILNQG